MVSDRLFPHIGQAVRFLAGLYHLIHFLGHGTDMSGYLTNQATGLFRHIAEFRVVAECLFQLRYIIQQYALVTNGYRDDMIQG